jgi:hypothetical protein
VPSVNVNLSITWIEMEVALEHNGVFVELTNLVGLFPSTRTFHPGNTHSARPVVHPTDEFFDLLRSSSV